MSLVDLPANYCDGPTFIGHDLWIANGVGSGCSIIDIHFPHLIKIAGMSFKNNYTMEIQIWLKYRVKLGSQDHKKDATKSLWVLAVPKMILMPHPHYEKGGNEYFSVRHQSTNYVTCVRIVLKQPSPVWKTYSIHRISILEDVSKFPDTAELFVDDEFEARLKFLRLIQQQTKKCLAVAEHTDEGERDEAETIRSERIDNRLMYEVDLLADAQLVRLIK